MTNSFPVSKGENSGSVQSPPVLPPLTLSLKQNITEEWNLEALLESARWISQLSPDNLPTSPRSTNGSFPHIDTLGQPITDETLTEPIDTSKNGAAIGTQTSTVSWSKMVEPEADPGPEISSNRDQSLLLLNNSECPEVDRGGDINNRRVDTGLLEILATLAVNAISDFQERDSPILFSEGSQSLTDIAVNPTDTNNIIPETQKNLDSSQDEKSKVTANSIEEPPMSEPPNDCLQVEEDKSAVIQESEAQVETSHPISVASVSPEPRRISKRFRAKVSDKSLTRYSKRQRREAPEIEACILVRIDFENV